ncbi:MAG: hypothetical protein HY208_02255 [Nitrospirae bacterium]|nr:hypothetical protein [Nitrospirota bacterium]
MKGITSGMAGMAVLAVGSLAMAQMSGGSGGGEMMGDKGHGYGMAGGYMAWWAAYGLVKAVVVVIGLWLLLRIARAVEKIAASK